jgi:lysophospholipase L1-like esterase
MPAQPGIERDQRRRPVLRPATLLLTLLVVGCGSSTATKSTPPDRTIVVAALGDGITAGSPGFDPSHGNAKLLGFAENPQSQWEYWAQQADPRLRFRNCGVYGERTDEIAKRLVACGTGAEVLVVEGGLDDIAQGRPVAKAARNLRAMVTRAKTLGLRAEIAQVIPWSNGWPDAAPKILALNRLIAAIGRAEHVRVLPFYAVLDDPQHPGRMKEAWTADGDNPSVEGYRRLGELAFRLP